MEQQINLLNIIDNIEWDYKFNVNNLYFASQNDWNNTLLTKINQSGAMLFQHINKDYTKNIRTGKKYILSPSKFEDIFKNILYYDELHKELAGRFNVSFFDSNEDSIFIVYETNTKIPYSVKINILNYV